MDHSNYTLKFPRTSRECFGYQARFEQRDPDRAVGIAFVLIAVFVCGLVVGGAL